METLRVEIQGPGDNTRARERAGIFLFWLCALACGGADKVGTVEPTVYEHVTISSPYHVDGFYPSMTGPYGVDRLRLLDGERPELVWVVGYETEVISADEGVPISQEWMCHANLDFEPESYFRLFPTAPSLSGRMFTLSQGQQTIRFPDGHGIPLSSHLPMSLVTQVLNLNNPDVDLSVRHKVTISYIRDSERRQPMVPLFQGAVEGFKALDASSTHYGVLDGKGADDILGPGCSVGQAAIAGDMDLDRHGQKFTAHWRVPPGREVNVTNVTRFLSLPYDTTVHYIAVHLHPFAQSLTLRDRTLDEVVYRAKATNTTDRVGLAEVDYFSSAEGIPLYKDHEYELISVYDNTSDATVDSMAVMYLYMKDQRYRPPSMDVWAAAATKADPPPPGNSMGGM